MTTLNDIRLSCDELTFSEREWPFDELQNMFYHILKYGSKKNGVYVTAFDIAVMLYEMNETIDKQENPPHPFYIRRYLEKAGYRKRYVFGCPQDVGLPPLEAEWLVELKDAKAQSLLRKIYKTE